MIEQGIFKRTELLVGKTVMDAIENASVIVFGVGGVGSWCVESLVRSGIRKITIVDSDAVCITNINRQLMATTKTVGKPKVDVLKQRLLEINPLADIDARCVVYSEQTAESFHLETYDYVIDAIDSLDNKASLIRRACSSGAVLFSSMGAALKMDPAKISVTEFWKVRGCPLGAALRRKFKKSKLFPSKKFKCVYSEELLQNVGTCGDCGTEECVCKKNTSGNDADWRASKSFFVQVLCLPENKDCRRLGVEKWIQTKCRQLYIFRIHNLGGIHRESLSLRLSMSGHFVWQCRTE